MDTEALGPRAAGLTAEKVVRRFLLWAVLCSVCAAPSFIWAASQYDVAAMLVGVGAYQLYMRIRESRTEGPSDAQAAVITDG